MNPFKIALSGAALVASAIFAGCTKEDNTVFNAQFYSTHASDGALTLYINDAYRGDLTYRDAPPTCGGGATDGGTTLALQLPAGEYRVAAKNASGQTISSALMKIGKCKNGARGNGPGGMSMSNDGSCVIVGLWQ